MIIHLTFQGQHHHSHHYSDDNMSTFNKRLYLVSLCIGLTRMSTSLNRLQSLWVSHQARYALNTWPRWSWSRKWWTWRMWCWSWCAWCWCWRPPGCLCPAPCNTAGSWSAPRSTCSTVGTAQEAGEDNTNENNEYGIIIKVSTLVKPFLMSAGCSGWRDIRASCERFLSSLRSLSW